MINTCELFFCFSKVALRKKIWVVKKSVPDRFFNQYWFFNQKNQKKKFVFRFFSLTRRNKPVLVLATYRHSFSGRLGTSVSEKPWFMTENIDFLTRNLFFWHFSATTTLSKRMKNAFWGKFLRWFRIREKKSVLHMSCYRCFRSKTSKSRLQS